MRIEEILKKSVEMGGSDVFIIPASSVTAKCNGVMKTLPDEERLSVDDSLHLISEIYEKAHREMDKLKATGDDDFSFSIPGVGRFRCNAYKQRSSYAAVLRIVVFELPDYSKLNIPETIMELANIRKGMVLVTGPAGSGKSTTLACIIDKINHSSQGHIITLEDPLEFLHSHDKSIITQREIMQDTENYDTALRAALRQAPDVILLGEMRDYETIHTALTAAETGQLLLSSLHTIGAAKTIDRIIDVFPASQQAQIRVQLSMVLKAVVSQQLVPTVNGDLIPAFEIMKVTPAIETMIRDEKIYQIDNVIYQGADEGMCTMNGSLEKLYRSGVITRDTAMIYSTNPEQMGRRLM